MLRTTIRFHSTRLPPRSLLVKQANRLNKKDNDSSRLIVTSLRDIGALFQANSQTQEDDELELLNHKHYINQLIESGELERLAVAKFRLNRDTNKIPVEMLINKFNLLTREELEIVKEATNLQNTRPWTQSPLYLKQLSYYLSFGSYGPRIDIPFRIRSKPLDFTFKSNCVNDRKSNRIRKLSKDQLLNPLTATKERELYFNGKNLDPLSKIVLWSAICVSVIVGWQEWQLKKQDKSR